MYDCWLGYKNLKFSPYKDYLKAIVICEDTIDTYDALLLSALSELRTALSKVYEDDIVLQVYKSVKEVKESQFIKLNLLFLESPLLKDAKSFESFTLSSCQKNNQDSLCITSYSSLGLLYGVFELLRLLSCNYTFTDAPRYQTPKYPLRMINHWDNIDGTVERGYSGNSIFFEESKITKEINRINDYGRLLCSIGINAIVINNTNVHEEETRFITSKIHIVKTISDILEKWGIRTFLSINFAAPITLKELDTADPLDAKVIQWWKNKIEYLYTQIPNLGGLMVKADSEGRPGPFTYGRKHSHGANMLGEALKPYQGILIWRCFVYNCQQDWRDRSIDRARASYDHFNPLDKEFLPNVYLQIKNGPMDFQVREPISPLFGSMDHTNKLMEFQITQEYTGQQKHICYLIPWWRELLNASISRHKVVSNQIVGVAAVSNIGNDENWTGHPFAQANLYGYGRLIWDSTLNNHQITNEWILQTFGWNSKVTKIINKILLTSWPTYEKYTAPLGVGWMVSPNHHYGPDVDGYEYSRWGTYHYADHKGIGVNRTVDTGTGYSGQYNEPLTSKYNNLSSCPDELLLFFHHVPYTHLLHSGKTVIQHIYDSHFEGYDQVKEFIAQWISIKELLPEAIFTHTFQLLTIQLESAKDWCDQINTYFYRLSNIEDEKGRTIY
jgi:alpha-glucuronidase